MISVKYNTKRASFRSESLHESLTVCAGEGGKKSACRRYAKHAKFSLYNDPSLVRSAANSFLRKLFQTNITFKPCCARGCPERRIFNFCPAETLSIHCCLLRTPVFHRAILTFFPRIHTCSFIFLHP